MTAILNPVAEFWRQAGPPKWFAKDAAFDADFRARFLDLHYQAARRELESWLGNAEDALGLMILLDQFPRNCFRDTGHMYATDTLARHYTLRAIAAGLDAQVTPDLRLFFYLPLSHSEDIADQDRAVALNTPLGGDSLSHAEGHRDIIRRFGRFPHRNAILARETTAEEQAFLDGGGFKG